MSTRSRSTSSSKRDFSAALSHSLVSIGKSNLILKDKQIEALQHLYEGKDVFLWLPTGYGKSLCFQLLPFLFDFKFDRSNEGSQHSVVLVVSPLVSLMVNQVCQLQSAGVSAAILSGNKGVDKKYQVVDQDFVEGKYRLVYTSPEALFTRDQWILKLLEPPLCNCLAAIAIDEAHCVYKW